MLLALLCAGALAAQAQESALSLKELWRLARQRHLGLAEQDLLRQQALQELAFHEAEGRPLGSAQAGYGYTSQVARLPFELPGIGRPAAGTRNRCEAALVVEQPLYTGGGPPWPAERGRPPAFARPRSRSAGGPGAGAAPGGPALLLTPAQSHPAGDSRPGQGRVAPGAGPRPTGRWAGHPLRCPGCGQPPPPNPHPGRGTDRSGGGPAPAPAAGPGPTSGLGRRLLPDPRPPGFPGIVAERRICTRTRRAARPPWRPSAGSRSTPMPPTATAGRGWFSSRTTGWATYSVGLNARWPLWDKGRRSPARKPRK